MSGFIIRNIYFILLFGITISANAQSVVWPSSVRIGTDVLMAGESVIKNGKRKFEVTGDIDIYKYFIAIDYGWSQRYISDEGYEYQNSGNYARIGADYNFIYSDIENHVIYFGLRYARSFFKENFDYTINDNYYGSYDLYEENVSGKARWLEMNVGLKARVWKQLFVGWTGRYKFAKKASGSSGFSVFEIPGYGKAENKSNWGFNYYIYYRFPFRDKPQILLKPDKESGSQQ